MDTSLLKSDIFFVIATVAVIIISIIVAVAIIYIISILHTVWRIAKIAHSQAESLTEDISDLRQEIKERGASLKGLFGFITRMTKRRVNKKK